MRKQVLKVYQMQHLQERGLKLKNTMLSWCKFDEFNEEYKLIFSGMFENWKLPKVPAYTLQDVLDALPTEIVLYKTRCWLSIDFVEGLVEYYSENCDEVREHMQVEPFYNDMPLIDAAYELLCLAVNNGFVETNKSE